MIQAGDYVVSLNSGLIRKVQSIGSVGADQVLNLAALPSGRIFWLYPYETRPATASEVLEAKLKGLL